jgi:methionine-rich copper-binding protein CopC
MKKTVFLFTATMVLMTSNVFAHAGLKSSAPKDNAMLMSSPKALQLQYTKAVVLAKVTMQDKQGAEVDIDFKPTTKASNRYDISLPALASGNYRVSWTVMGSDAHKMTGDFSFMVHAAKSVAAANMAQKHADTGKSDSHNH